MKFPGYIQETHTIQQGCHPLLRAAQSPCRRPLTAVSPAAPHTFWPGQPRRLRHPPAPVLPAGTAWRWPGCPHHLAPSISRPAPQLAPAPAAAGRPSRPQMKCCPAAVTCSPHAGSPGLKSSTPTATTGNQSRALGRFGKVRRDIAAGQWSSNINRRERGISSVHTRGKSSHTPPLLNGYQGWPCVA